METEQQSDEGGATDGIFEERKEEADIPPR